MSRKIPEVLTIEEQDRLLNQFNLRYITPHRNKTMIKLILASGLRLAEMSNLKWKEVNLLIGQIKVVDGKGGKDRILWIDEDTTRMLQDWKIRQFKEWGKSEYVFTTRTLKQLDGKAVKDDDTSIIWLREEDFDDDEEEVF
jgi:site-specific recombinase XerD